MNAQKVFVHRGNGSPAAECSTVMWTAGVWAQLTAVFVAFKPLYRRVLPGLAVKDIV